MLSLDWHAPGAEMRIQVDRVFADASGAIASLEITDVLADQADAVVGVHSNSSLSIFLARGAWSAVSLPSSRCARWRPVSGPSFLGRAAVRPAGSQQTSRCGRPRRCPSRGAPSPPRAARAARRAAAVAGPRPVFAVGLFDRRRRFFFDSFFQALLFLLRRFRSLREPSRLAVLAAGGGRGLAAAAATHQPLLNMQYLQQ